MQNRGAKSRLKMMSWNLKHVPKPTQRQQNGAIPHPIPSGETGPLAVVQECGGLSVGLGGLCCSLSLTSKRGCGHSPRELAQTPEQPAQPWPGEGTSSGHSTKDEPGIPLWDEPLRAEYATALVIAASFFTGSLPKVNPHLPLTETLWVCSPNVRVPGHVFLIAPNKSRGSGCTCPPELKAAWPPAH